MRQKNGIFNHAVLAAANKASPNDIEDFRRFAKLKDLLVATLKEALVNKIRTLHRGSKSRYAN